MNHTSNKIVVSCPTCKKNVIWSEQQKFKPFCCERCKLIDFGEWAAEEKKIPGDPASAEADFSAESNFF